MSDNETAEVGTAPLQHCSTALTAIWSPHVNTNTQKDCHGMNRCPFSEAINPQKSIEAEELPKLGPVPAPRAVSGAPGGALCPLMV